MIRLRAERIRQGLTQAELARRAGLDQTDISRLENERRVFPGHVKKVSQALGIRPDRAFDDVRLLHVIQELRDHG